MIPPQFLDDLRRRLSLAEYVGRYTALTVVGGTLHYGSCPYCDAAGCRIMVYDQPKTMPPFYKCMPVEVIESRLEQGRSVTCRAGGCVIGLTMRMENISFRHAVARLCAEADFEPPEECREFVGGG